MTKLRIVENLVNEFKIVTIYFSCVKPVLMCVTNSFYRRTYCETWLTFSRRFPRGKEP